MILLFTDSKKNLKEQHLKAEAGETKLKKLKKRNERELSVTDFDGNEIVFITRGEMIFSRFGIVSSVATHQSKQV